MVFHYFDLFRVKEACKMDILNLLYIHRAPKVLGTEIRVYFMLQEQKPVV